MNLQKIESLAIDIANCIYGDLNTKLKAKDSIMALTAYVCKAYDNDLEFKNKLILMLHIKNCISR